MIQTTLLPEPTLPFASLDETLAPDILGELDAVGRYLRQAARYERLDAEGELALGRRIKAGRLEDGGFDADATQAIQSLAQANLRLVYHVAKGFRPRREEMMDLISAASIGLMKSAREYDADLGHRFSTYAFWNIRSHIQRELHGQGRAVHLPRNIHEKFTRLRQAEERLTQASGRAPTDAELAAELGLSEEKLTELLAFRQYGVSLDAPVDETGPATLGDLLADEEADSPAESAARADERALVHQLLLRLTPREAEVLRLRGGIHGREHTFDEIGRRLKVTRERVRQIEASALKKLKAEARH